MSRVAPLALAAALCLTVASVSAQGRVAQQETRYATLSARNGFDYQLDESQGVIVYVDESHSYLAEEADSAVVHVFGQRPDGAWVEIGEPTTVKALGTLAGAPAGTSFALAEGVE